MTATGKGVQARSPKSRQGSGGRRNDRRRCRQQQPQAGLAAMVERARHGWRRRDVLVDNAAPYRSISLKITEEDRTMLG